MLSLARQKREGGIEERAQRREHQGEGRAEERERERERGEGGGRTVEEGEVR